MKKILLLCIPGMELMEFAPFVDIFGWNHLLGSKDTLLEIASFSEEINTSWELKLPIPKRIQDIQIQDYVALVIPGGFGRFGYFSEKRNPVFHASIQEALKYNLYLLGICTGSLLLAETELFHHRKMTTYLLEEDRYFKQLKQHQVLGERVPVCKDDKLWTSSAPATAIPMAFDLLEELTSFQNRQYIESIMGF